MLTNICSDKKFTFIELLENNDYVSVLKRNLRFPIIIKLKFERGLVPALCNTK